MNLTPEEQQELNTLLAPYTSDPTVLQMKDYVQHGAISTYEHCMRVTELSYLLSRRLKLHSDEQALVTGAFLHDFYLYDWHCQSLSNGLHGFTHPIAACRNARKLFHISPKAQHIIRCHMWPLTLLHMPLCREAALVCIADKYCSLEETLLYRKRVNQPC